MPDGSIPRFEMTSHFLDPDGIGSVARVPLCTHPIAHLRQSDNSDWECHPLDEHLRSVGALAREFAAEFGNGDWGSAAGFWHDLGKYKTAFQAYIRTANGLEAHLEEERADRSPAGKVDHSAAGALHAQARSRQAGRALSYLIAGHHAGLPDWIRDEAAGKGLEERLSEAQHLQETLSGKPPAAILDAPLPATHPCSGGMGAEHLHLWIRMLFSCLADADFLDTEAFMDPAKSESRAKSSTLGDLRERFDQYMFGLQNKVSDTLVNRVRRQILKDCREGAAKDPGFFSLTVPTGGGKTLASMGFALDHALLHGKRRIIVVIPYTSIIEQTAQVLRSVFGDDTVLEHHSNLDPDRETPRSRLASENWDAPIIVTTNVQLFESLFASRASACRKLHNLANSIIVLDEAQMLPPEFLKPILSVLKGLVQHFGVTAVLCTATQPALVGRIGGDKLSNRESFEGLPTDGSVRELMRDPEDLARRLKRVRIERHSNGDGPCSWEEIAGELSQLEQVLCIVNSRKDCRALHALMPPDTVHLSALMCGEHRTKTIKEIKESLAAGIPIRVVSTQLVEAGVDLDFPVVYRAVAGLDSIAQAAGRCNREGRSISAGRVVVFTPPESAPPGLLLKGENATRELLHVAPELVESLSPEAFRKYFECFYAKLGFDEKGIQDLLTKNAERLMIQFRTAAQRFRMIDDAGQKSVIVWYSKDRFDSQMLLEELRRFGPTRGLMRRLQRCTVTIPERIWKGLLAQGAVMDVVGPDGAGTGLWAQAIPGLYDGVFGLRLEGPVFQGDEFIC